MDAATTPFPLSETPFERWLAMRLDRVDCPTSLELGEFEAGLLAADLRFPIELHLLECPACRKELNFLRDFSVAKPAVHSQTATETELVPQAVLVPMTVRRLIARLQNAGSAFQAKPAWGALRGSVGEQLVYQVDAIQIVIEVQEDLAQPDHKTMLGLVLGLDIGQPITVQLARDGVAVAAMPLDALGNFVFQSLPSALYQITLLSRDIEIVLEQVTV